jgi:hypothetical protein
MVEFVDVNDILKENKLAPPQLKFLVADEERYSTLLYQPRAKIEYDPAFGLRDADRATAVSKFSQFLKLASSSDADLVGCPEYSCPWDAILSAVDAGHLPKVEKLWALGCEALSLGDLDVLEDKFAAKKVKLIVRKPSGGEDGKTFVDPVCFLFQTKNSKGKDVNVALIQLKTEAMGDQGERFEPEYLRCGSYIYRFRNPTNVSLVFFTLICSDVLPFGRSGANPIRLEIEKQESQIILHLQLNLAARQGDYAKYRQYCLHERPNKDVLCLNWARGTTIEARKGGKRYELRIPFSGIYSKNWPKSVSSGDAHKAHKSGLYLNYWGETRGYVGVINFEELVVIIGVLKPMQFGVAQAQRGMAMPVVRSLRAWNSRSGDFDEGTATALLQACDGSKGTDVPHALLSAAPICGPLLSTFERRPFELERFISVSTRVALRYSPEGDFIWPAMEATESCVLGDGEIVRRLTFIQDESAKAVDYRDRALKAFAAFDGARLSAKNFPDHVAAFGLGNQPFLQQELPFANLKADSGEIGLFVFDDSANDSTVDATYRRCVDELREHRIDQKGRQERAKAKGATLAEPLVEDWRALVWYWRMEGGSAKLIAYPGTLENEIVDASAPVPGDIRGH